MDSFERIYEEIKSEEVGVWFTNENGQDFIIVKAPLNSCKAIIHGCQVQILLGIDTVAEVPIIHSGIRVYDDLENPMIITNAHRHSDDNESLFRIINQETCAVVLYSELCVPLIYGQIQLDSSKCRKMIDLVEIENHFYSGKFNTQTIQSSDSFCFTIDDLNFRPGSYKIELIILDSLFSEWNSPKHHFVGIVDQAETRVTEPLEGSTFEKHIWFSLESVFPYELFLSPQFNSGTQKKEVIDILAFHQYGIFLIEAKSLSIYEGNVEKSMDRKVLTTQKHIKKAIKQLIGANESMKRGTVFYNSKDEPIEFNRNIVPHCIVLVAELYHFGDWTEIEMLMFKVMSEKVIYLHVFDLRELLMLLKSSKVSKEYFDYNLMQRAKLFVETESIHLRSRPDLGY